MNAPCTLAATGGADRAILAGAFREPAIDLVHLARQTGGDAALEAELLALFELQSTNLASRLAATELPRRARADIAHRLKGSALAIGAARVANAAQAVETEFESEPTAVREPTRALVELAAAVAEARAAIAALRG